MNDEIDVQLEIIDTITVTVAAEQGPPGAGLAENVVSANGNLANGNQHLVNKGAGLCTLTLPAMCPLNGRILIQGNPLSTGGWWIAQNAGQRIYVSGGSSSTLGVAGSVQSVYPGSSIELRCITENTFFLIVNTEGEISLN